ncbi:hypothetical protein PAAG_11182 [Paracoccidioides lutzii Pb01]|uniref:Uncharacterized protein n=1 Tax=Paracoccidioides lutzii (strain ATCC MYA-826 / Pb01) TaxID=502779 RepID=A0A0A2V3D8_PARBA|nr:hypothetical protein PAAG_11182 [Paracoccidioides lutzii Pb01]KGQ02008.1 hypothetical protein PAAG_11182 [Paracoccidioides lutzii Pb01]
MQRPGKSSLSREDLNGRVLERTIKVKSSDPSFPSRGLHYWESGQKRRRKTLTACNVYGEQQDLVDHQSET